MSRKIRVTLDVTVEAHDRADAAVRVARQIANGYGALVTHEPDGEELDKRGPVLVRVWPETDWGGRES